MPPTMDQEAPRYTSISGSHAQNSEEVPVVDLTLLDNSDSDVDSIIGSIPESAIEVDKKLPTPNTSDSSRNEGDTTRPPSSTSSSDEGQNCDDNDIKACVSLIRKRKRDARSDDAVTLKRTKPNGSALAHSPTNTRAFHFEQLSNVSNFFGGISQLSAIKSRAVDRQARDVSEERMGKDKAAKGDAEEETDPNKEARHERVISHPFLLYHVREKSRRSRGRSQTGHSQSRQPNSRDVAGRAQASQKTPGGSKPSGATTDGRPDEPPGITAPTRPAVQRASSADPPVTTLKRRRATFAGLTAPRKDNLPDGSQTNSNANQPLCASRRSSQARPLTINTNQNGSEDSFFDPGAVNAENALPQTSTTAQARPHTSTKTARRDRVDSISVSDRSLASATSTTRNALARKRPTCTIPTSRSTHDSSHHRTQLSNLATSHGVLLPPEPSQSHEPRGGFGRERRSEVTPEYAQPTESRWERIARLDRPSTRKEAGRGARLPKLAKLTRPQPQLRGEASQPRRGGINDNTYRAEAHLQRAQKPQSPSKRVNLHSQPAHNNGSGAVEPAPREEFRQPPPKDTSSNAAPAENQFLRLQQPQPLSKRNTYQSLTAHHNGNDNIKSRRPLPTATNNQLRREVRPEMRELADDGLQDLQEMENTRRVVQNRSPQARETIKIPAIASRPAPSSPRSKDAVFADAAADMKALYAQYEKKSNTTLVDSLPPNFGMAQPDHQSRARAVRNIELRERNKVQHQEKLIRKQLGRIKQRVQREFPDELEEYRNSIVEERLNTYKANKRKRDLNERERFNAGLLTVDLLEGRQGGGFNGEEVDLNARRIPASEVLEPAQAIVCYPVYMTEPLEEGANYEDFLQRTKAFGKMDSANFYAKQLLEGHSSPNPSRSRNKAQRVLSQSIIYLNDLLFGSMKLGDGKTIYVMVQKDTVLVGDLDPNVLRSKWIDEDVLELYQNRYDIWLTRVIPRAWQLREDEDEEARAKRDRANERAQKKIQKQAEKLQQKRHKKASDKEDQPAAEEDDPQGLDGSRLRAALKALSNPVAKSWSGVDETSDRDGEESDVERGEDCGGDADDDTSSQASDETVRHRSLPLRTRPPGLQSHQYPDFYENFIVESECWGSYTDLRLANEQAFELAIERWRPRTVAIDAKVHYENIILPELQSAKENGDLDSNPLQMNFPEFFGNKDHRPWGFVNAQLTVVETTLKGPRDIGFDFVFDMSDSTYRPTIAESPGANVRPGGNQEAEFVDLADSGSEPEEDEEVAAQHYNDDDEESKED